MKKLLIVVLILMIRHLLDMLVYQNSKILMFTINIILLLIIK